MLSLLLLFVAPSNQDHLDQKECYHIHVVLYDEPLHDFEVSHGKLCRDYCISLVECNSFVYYVDNLAKCTLYREEALLSNEIDIYSSSVRGIKSCLVTFPNLNVMEITEESHKDGVIMLIKRPKETHCLVRGTPLKGTHGFSVLWSKQCQQSIVWTLEFKDYSSLNEFIKVKVKIKNRNICLTVTSASTREKPRAILMSCDETEVFPFKKRENYLINWFNLYKYTGSQIEISWLLACPLSNKLLIAPKINSSGYVDGSEELNAMHITPKDQFVDKVCSDVQVENGKIPSLEKVPFLLYGENFMVVCDAGFGRSVDNITFVTEFSALCSIELTLIRCSKIPDDLIIGQCASQIVESKVFF